MKFDYLLQASALSPQDAKVPSLVISVTYLSIFSYGRKVRYPHHVFGTLSFSISQQKKVKLARPEGQSQKIQHLSQLVFNCLGPRHLYVFSFPLTSILPQTPFHYSHIHTHLLERTSLPIMNLDNLRDAVQNISLYDVKAAVRKAQNGELFHPPFGTLGML